MDIEESEEEKKRSSNLFCSNSFIVKYNASVKRPSPDEHYFFNVKSNRVVTSQQAYSNVFAMTSHCE